MAGPHRSVRLFGSREWPDCDRDDFDPYLMPGDALACYDSSVINITDLATKIGIVGALGVII